MPLDIESRIADRSEARADSAEEVKKLVGLSRAEFTFLPVASRFCVLLNSDAVFCRAIRFCRTPADRVTLLGMVSNLSGRTSTDGYTRSLWIGQHTSHEQSNVA